MAFITFAGSFLLQWGFKFFYKVPRISPEVNSWSLTTFIYSFPSGFIAIFTALMGITVIFTFTKKDKLRSFFIAGLFFFIMFVAGISRIHAEISYPSDVLAGFLLGGLWVAACIVATKALEHYN